MTGNRTIRCGACGHIGKPNVFTWPVECSMCGEIEKVELLVAGRGLYPSTIPADAMDQLMRQMPGGWFFKRKAAWQNVTRKEKMEVQEFMGKIRELHEKFRGDERLRDITGRIMEHLDPDSLKDDDA